LPIAAGAAGHHAQRDTTPQPGVRRDGGAPSSSSAPTRLTTFEASLTFQGMPLAQEGGTGGSACATFTGMDDFPIIPPIIVKDTPKPRRITTIKEARDYVDEAMRLGRPASWREVSHRIKMVTGEDEAIEAIGDLRELLAEEDLLLPDGGTR
jgi:hypothetical protein